MEHLHLQISEAHLTNHQGEIGHDHLVGEALSSIEKQLHLRTEKMPEPLTVDFKDYADIYSFSLKIGDRGPQMSLILADGGHPGIAPNVMGEKPSVHMEAHHPGPQGTERDHSHLGRKGPDTQVSQDEYHVQHLAGNMSAHYLDEWHRERGETSTPQELAETRKWAGEQALAKMHKNEKLAGDQAVETRKEADALAGRPATPGELAEVRREAVKEEAHRSYKVAKAEYLQDQTAEQDAGNRAEQKWQMKNPGRNLSQEDRQLLHFEAGHDALLRLHDTRWTAGKEAVRQEETIARVLHEKEDPLAIDHKRQEAELQSGAQFPGISEN